MADDFDVEALLEAPYRKVSAVQPVLLLLVLLLQVYLRVSSTLVVYMKVFNIHIEG